MRNYPLQNWWIFTLAAVIPICCQSTSVGESSLSPEQPVFATRMESLIESVDVDADVDVTTVDKSDGTSVAIATCCDWCVPKWYARVDGLVWWAKGNRVPALVTTSPDQTDRVDAGVLFRPGTQVLHGGERIDDNHRFGGRVSVGYWLDDCQNTAVEVSWFSLGDGANSGNYYNQSTGSPILARPFFDVQSGQQNAELVAFPDVVDGSVQVATSSEVHSLAALLRHNALRGCDGRIDILAGYRFLRFREGLTVDENLISTEQGGAVAIGTTFDLWDSFSTGNEFHGGELGLDFQLERCRWTWNAMAKLAVGNVHQVVDVDGLTRITAPADTPATSEGGLLALPTNIGRVSHNRFAMIPELNLNVQYRLLERLDVSFGYSLVWITSVVRSGDQIDFAVNPSQLPGNGGSLSGDARPAPRFETTSMWLQGINAGLVLEF
jgi:hypothetical protein